MQSYFGKTMNLYEGQFSEELDQPQGTAPIRNVLIASTPRCGSHMLGHAMTDTGLLGIPMEYCNPGNMKEWRTRLKTTTPQETLAAIRARRTTPNGIFADRAHFDHCAPMGGPEALFDLLPGVIHLRRADVLRQAISFAVAWQTGVWITGQEAVSDAAVYDAGLIRSCLNDIAIQNANWVSTFAAAGIVPLNVFYESTAQDLDRDITAIARFVGAIGDGDTLKARPRTRKQSLNQRTEDWIRRYRDDQRTPPSLMRRIKGKAGRILKR